MDIRDNVGIGHSDISNGADSASQLLGGVADTGPAYHSEIKENLTANFTPGTDKRKIEGIVVHRTEGSLASALDWLHNPESRASYHVIIDENGVVHKLVNDRDIAWHAGAVVRPQWRPAMQGINPNEFTLGVGLSGHAGQPLTIQQFIALCIWINEKCDLYNLPLDTKHIVPHNNIRGDKTCPGVEVSIASILYVSSILRN